MVILNKKVEEEQEILNNLKRINEIIKIDKKPLIEILQISPDILDKRGNRFKNWGIKEKRGGEDYIPPINGWYGIGLKVEGKYDNGNNDWLDYNNRAGEYAIGYIGINNIYNDQAKMIEDVTNLQEKMDAIKNKMYITDKNTRIKSSLMDKLSYIFRGCSPDPNIDDRCGEGVCVFQNPDHAENSAGIVEVPGYKIKILLMCRVNPKSIRQPQLFPEVWIVNPEDIRQYRILIKKIPTSELTEEKNTLTFIETPDDSIINIIKSNDFSFRDLSNNKIFEKASKINGQNIDDDFFAIRLYTDKYYKNINGYLRSKKMINNFFTEEQLKSWICCLQLALSRKKNVKENSIVFRGVDLKFPTKIGIGSKFYFKEFISTSTKKSVSESWIKNKGGTIMTISIKNNGINGHPNYCFYAEDITMNKKEYEVLIASHCFFTVTKLERGGNIDYISLICEGYLFN